MAGRIIETIDEQGKNHLSNVLDGNTGKQLTYTETSEINSDAQSDGVVFRKYNNKYYKLNQTSVDLKQYGVSLSGLVNLIAKSSIPIKTIVVSELINLNGGTYTLPPDLVLDFKGGSFQNGTIVSNNTLYKGAPLFKVCLVTGTILNDKAFFEWFGAVGIEGIDDSDAISFALNSNFRKFRITKVHWLSSPVNLASRKLIQGTGYKGNMLTGFRANANFSPKLVSFPAKNGKPAFTQTVYGMFYHRDVTVKMIDVFIDAQFRAEFCIEHIDQSGSCDLYKGYILGATIAGVLLYGSEAPSFEYTTFLYNNVNIYISKNKINKLDLLDFTGVAMGSPNIVKFTNNYSVLGNYGIIANVTSDINLEGTAFGHNSRCAGYLGALNVNLRGVYSENDGSCESFVSPSGYDPGTPGTVHPSMLAQNIDGFSIKDRQASEYFFNTITYYRSPFVFHSGVATVTGAFISYKPRSFQPTNATAVELPIVRSAGGIDAMFMTVGNAVVSAEGVAEYQTNANTGAACLYYLIEGAPFVYQRNKVDRITLNSGNKKRPSNQTFHLPCHTGNSNDVSDYGVSSITGDVGFTELNTFQNGKVNSFGIFVNATQYALNEYVETYRGWNLFRMTTPKSVPTLDISHFGNAKYIVVEGMIKVSENTANLMQVRLFDETNTQIKVYSNNSSGATENYVKDQYRLMRIVVPISVYGKTVKTVQAGFLNARNSIQSQVRIYEYGNPNKTILLEEDKYVESGTSSERPTIAPLGWVYYDTTLAHSLVLKTIGNYSKYTFNVNSGASTSGNITIRLNNVDTVIPVTAGQTAIQVADKIRATMFTYLWSASGTDGTSSVVITKNMVGVNASPVFTDSGATGVSISIVENTVGSANVWTSQSPKTGTSTFTGNGQTTISIPHGLGAVPLHTDVATKSAAATTAGISSWTEDATNIILTVATPNTGGTLTYSWEAKL